MATASISETRWSTRGVAPGIYPPVLRDYGLAGKSLETVTKPLTSVTPADDAAPAVEVAPAAPA